MSSPGESKLALQRAAIAAFGSDGARAWRCDRATAALDQAPDIREAARIGRQIMTLERQPRIKFAQTAQA
jgi:hypothetical protein